MPGSGDGHESHRAAGDAAVAGGFMGQRGDGDDGEEEKDTGAGSFGMEPVRCWRGTCRRCVWKREGLSNVEWLFVTYRVLTWT